MTNVNSLLKKDPKSYSILTSSSEIGENLAVEVYVVGGSVRDVIIGNNLSDIDIMVVGDGINYARKLLTKLDGNSIVPFKKFGTAQILLDDDLIEVSSARSESYITNSRKPKIDSADLRTDLSRRDFTINAMAVSLNKSDFGELHDPYNGIRDLNRGVIQTPLDPNQTFSDDPLRMLRAIRFASQLDFKIDPKIKDSIKKHTQRIDIISAEKKGIDPKHIKDSISKIKENESDPDFFSAIKICKKRRIGACRDENNRTLFYKKDIGILARAGFDFEVSKRIMDLEKEEYLKIINLL